MDAAGGAPGLLQPCLLLLREADKPGAAFFPKRGFKFYNGRFQMPPGPEDAQGDGWLRARSGFVNSEGLSALSSSRCHV